MFVTFFLKLWFGHPNLRKAYFLRHVPLGLFSHADRVGFIYPGVSGISDAPKHWRVFGNLPSLNLSLSVSLIGLSKNMSNMFLRFTSQMKDYLQQHLLLDF